MKNDLFEAFEDIGADAIRTVWRAIVVGIIGGALAVCALNSQAATSINCAPQTKHAQPANSSKLRSAKSDTGRWFAWWCGAVDPADATRWIWKPQTYAVLKEYSAPLEAAIDAAAGDLESFSVLNTVITMPSVTPIGGSQEEFRWRMLRWSACQALTTKPYDIAFAPDLPANFCGAAPTPPVPDATWTATGGTIFTYAAGKLTGVTTRKATKGAPCDDRSITIVGATVYRSLASGPATEVTPCSKP